MELTQKLFLKKESGTFSKSDFTLFVKNQFAKLMKKNLRVPVSMYQL